jgi:DNA excision repair protein ERCC-8
MIGIYGWPHRSPTSEFMIATGSVDQTIRFWDIRRGAGPLLILDQHNNDTSSLLSIPPSSSSSSSPMGSVVRDGHRSTGLVSSHNGAITHMAFTPDGRTLLSSGTDRRLRSWDTLSGRNTLVNFPDTKNAARFNRFTISPDAQFVFYPNGIDVCRHTQY